MKLIKLTEAPINRNEYESLKDYLQQGQKTVHQPDIDTSGKGLAGVYDQPFPPPQFMKIIRYIFPESEFDYDIDPVGIYYSPYRQGLPMKSQNMRIKHDDPYLGRVAISIQTGFGGTGEGTDARDLWYVLKIYPVHERERYESESGAHHVGRLMEPQVGFYLNQKINDLRNKLPRLLQSTEESPSSIDTEPGSYILDQISHNAYILYWNPPDSIR